MRRVPVKEARDGAEVEEDEGEGESIFLCHGKERRGVGQFWFWVPFITKDEERKLTYAVI
jgi:hypothetical protein